MVIGLFEHKNKFMKTKNNNKLTYFIITSIVICACTISLISWKCQIDKIPQYIEAEKFRQETEQIKIKEYNKCINNHDTDTCNYILNRKEIIIRQLYKDCLSAIGGCGKDCATQAERLYNESY